MFCSKNNQLLFTASIKETSGYLDGWTIDNAEDVHFASTLPLSLSLWHKQLGYHNYDGIKQMIKANMVNGLILNSDDKHDPICEPCLAGKMHANPFPSSEYRVDHVLDLVHSDIHQVKVTSHFGYKYWVTFIDDNS